MWLFDKKTISDSKPESQQKFIELLKKDAQTLGRLRHPLILQLNKPIEETKTELFFETEPVIASLANVLGHTKNTQQVKKSLQKVFLDEVDIKLGLIQIFEALNFVHSTAKMIHLNVTPENIFITADGKWKLGGFGFSCYIMYKDKDETKHSYESFDQMEDKGFLPVKPSLNYIAPEYIFLNNYDTQSDIFSLGCVIYELFSKRRLLNCDHNISRYKADILNLFPLKCDKIPEALQAPLEKLLSQNLEKRYTPAQLLELPYFNDVSIRTLQYLHGILEKDDKSKAEFYKGLKSTFSSFSHNVLEERVLPILLQELRNTIFIPLILPNIFHLCETVSDESLFYRKAYPSLVNVMKIFQPFQIPLIFLNNIEMMAKRIKDSDINTTLVDLVCGALGGERDEVKFAALQHSVSVLQTFDYDKIANKILPQIINIVTSGSIRLKVYALFTLSKLVPLLSKPALESLFPVIYKMWKAERNPTFLMAIVGVCDAISLKLGDYVTSSKILPLIVSLLAEADMDRKQLDTFNTILNNMITRTYQSRIRAIEEKERINTMNSTTSSEGKSDSDALQEFTKTLPKTSDMVSTKPLERSKDMDVDPVKKQYYDEIVNRQEAKMRKDIDVEKPVKEEDPFSDFSWTGESSNLFDDEPPKEHIPVIPFTTQSTRVEPLSPISPISPISPMNPMNPISPVHSPLSTNSSTSTTQFQVLEPNTSQKTSTLPLTPTNTQNNFSTQDMFINVGSTLPLNNNASFNVALNNNTSYDLTSNSNSSFDFTGFNVLIPTNTNNTHTFTQTPQTNQSTQSNSMADNWLL